MTTAELAWYESHLRTPETSLSRVTVPHSLPDTWAAGALDGSGPSSTLPGGSSFTCTTPGAKHLTMSVGQRVGCEAVKSRYLFCTKLARAFWVFCYNELHTISNFDVIQQRRSGLLINAAQVNVANVEVQLFCLIVGSAQHVITINKLQCDHLSASQEHKMST